MTVCTGWGEKAVRGAVLPLRSAVTLVKRTVPKSASGEWAQDGGLLFVGHSTITSASLWPRPGLGLGKVIDQCHAFVVFVIDSVQVAPEILIDAVIASPGETGSLSLGPTSHAGP